MDIVTPLALATLLLAWALRQQLRSRRGSRARTPTSTELPRDHDYRLQRLLGSGGQARVHEAEHRASGQRVALKLGLAARAERRLRREAAILGRVNHPSVVGLLDSGETASRRPWMALELVEGVTLQSLLDGEGTLPPRRVAFLLGELAAALSAVHAAGFVHGDLKPTNVMVGFPASGERRAPVVKLLDFGLARHAGAPPTEPGRVVGTPAFIAPEVIVGEEADHASDVYALGVVAFQLLTGELPFGGRNEMSIMRKHLLVEAPDPSALVELPAGFSCVVERCLAKRSEDRPNMSSLRRELSFLAQGWGRRAEGAWWEQQLGRSAPLPLVRVLPRIEVLPLSAPRITLPCPQA
jgi:eukaryotic-like serine/threonine-protein kinase